MDHIQNHDEEVIDFPSVFTASSTISFAGFTVWCGAIVAFGALLMIAFVTIVDPYHLVGIVDAEGFNHIKPLPEQYREQIKIAQAKAVHPEVLLLGNSRIEVGVDPESGLLRSHGYSEAYNLALSGTTMASSDRAFKQVRNMAAPPAMALIGVEFLDFLVQPAMTRSSSPSAQAHSWQWRADTLFSTKAITDAVRTIQIQKAPEVETLTARGHNPLLEYRKYARQEGYHAIFRQRAQENAKTLVRKPHNLFVTATGSSESIDRLRDILDRMGRDGTEVHLIIYPYHAQLMAMFEAAGLQATMDEWKRLLVHEVENVRRNQPNSRITLWDFSGYGTAQCERIPLPGDMRSKTTWYWEAGHFKPSMGDRILRRILGEDTSFGIPLAADNFEQNRRRIGAERAHCAGNYPEVFADAHALIAEARTQLH